MKHIKSFVVFFLILGFRMIPVRPPNVEPILASLIPLSKRFGAVYTLLFTIMSVVVYDVLTVGIGTYTWSVALCYGLVALGTTVYFASRTITTMRTVGVSVAGVLFFDIMTGVVIGPVITGQSLAVAFLGQIPFTLLHLMGTTFFALIAVPILNRWFAYSSVYEVLPVSQVALK